MSGATAPVVAACRHWVFDLDGTLTRAVHDFALVRRALGIAPGADILAGLASQEPAQAAASHAWLAAYEQRLAVASQPAPGALALLGALHAAGCRLGILTLNTRALALESLAVIGAQRYVDPDEVIGRDELAPKPDPAGLHWFARRWGVAPARLCMVGDSRHDVACGRAAGVPTVLLGDGEPAPWPQLAQVHLADCAALLAYWRRAKA